MVSGVIAEFNIFHNGHKYLVDEAKKQSDAVVSVMSGSFVQRG
ncbi:MAG: nucleotidyltransferase family protein, partial [Clostridia bacterium]|nr:nucleotidyltransferase family protein [Clostridia bacterium]